MIARRIRLVFDAMHAAQVDCLLMGGQACVLYGAAEFSKDVDFVVLADAENFERLRAAMDSLEAEAIAVPDFDLAYLDEGLAVHLRCKALGLDGLRVDVMTKLRGVEPFPELWKRRFTLEDDAGGQLHLLGMPDLVAAKKTQLDKDWPMIQRLLEVNYLGGGESPSPDELTFWLAELRTPELLIDVATRFPGAAHAQAEHRPLLALAIEENRGALERALVDEMLEEKQRDREYWEPLRHRLGELRRARSGER